MTPPPGPQAPGDPYIRWYWGPREKKKSIGEKIQGMRNDPIFYFTKKSLECVFENSYRSPNPLFEIHGFVNEFMLRNRALFHL